MVNRHNNSDLHQIERCVDVWRDKLRCHMAISAYADVTHQKLIEKVEQ